MVVVFLLPERGGAVIGAVLDRDRTVVGAGRFHAD